ncbi:acetyl-CoA synthetase-like protein [Metschnikowia bicuspidata var. bicuspidata NRRL YB-4993]|uniref:Acetyl-CoA synthetase-like protein n=1 Tax=Metschnikowia bicuspidata var. bicuspidata NRRL YB-4993 TaxID=869754 RepID=A0A1A0H792_9ASCO|nr:acetyl-CoA synthetase-like protein [Metschnikowia bicuspidata var. bicuspidata NRRL YB-4993]OBA19964.1 acetyl-CoA synthetase-like protein [Metschnikowia bicuspidata var. bicuspidata NRRL YB-4993]
MNIGTGPPQLSAPIGSNVSAGITAYTAGGSPDVPPDMALLLQELEEDFTVNKTIDQWTYINRREEIMQLINKLHQPLNSNIAMDPSKLEKVLLPRKISDTSSLPKQALMDMLKQRAQSFPTDHVFMVLDAKGKAQQSILWEKLYLKSLKVAHELKHRTQFKSNDTVALLYKENEVCEFAVALFGCFMANVTAIPIHNDISLTEMFDILTSTSSLLVLMSESVSKELEKLSTASMPLVWPSKISRLRTTDLGSAKKSEQDAMYGRHKKEIGGSKNDLAYVGFSRSPVGELRGIAVSHRTISHQMNCLDTSLLSLPESGGNLVQSPKVLRRERKVFLATMDIRLSIGLIIGIMFSMYSGNLLVWAPPKVMEVQGLYANIISKFHANLLLADFLGLKRVTYDYQKAPNATRYFSKTQRVDFSSVKWVLVDALTVDGEFIEVLSERYLKPLGCPQSRNAIIPMLTLSEYGGMVISMRDWLGHSENLGIQINSNGGDDLSSVVIDKKALSQNKVCIIETNPFDSDEQTSDTLRVDAFGYPLPDATLAVVNPELSSVVLKGELGEIWIDSPCLSGGFYGLRKESKLVFHAKCRGANGTLDMEFLRTGLLGFTYNGKVYILGLYEDRIRQRFSWMDHKLQKKLNLEASGTTMRYHYSSHLLTTLANEVRQVYDCTIFDIFIGNEYLPVAIVEAEIMRKVIDDPEAISNNSAKSKDKFDYSAVPLNEPTLNVIAKRCFDALKKRHLLRLFCVVVVDCDTLPKIMRSGGLEIANMLCKKRFLEGTLRSEFIKFFINQSVSMIPRGEDVMGGIWSPFASQLRNSSLQNFPPQFSSMDYRPNVIDATMGDSRAESKSIIDLLKHRFANSGDAIAYQNIDTTGKSGSKPLSWKKLEQRIYAACQYIIEKTTLRPGQFVILMYSLSEEFNIILYACLMLGIIPIPMLPFDSNRIGEDFPAYVGVIKDFDVQEVFVNDDVERFMKNGPVADPLKKMNNRRAKPLRIKNTTKLTKISNMAHLNLKIAKYQPNANLRDDMPALVWLNFTSDHYRVGATLSHKNIINICKVFKETCNLSSSSSIVGCVRHSSGIGFVQALLLGVYLGTTTYLSSPVNFAGNPLSFFLSLAKYKVKDVFVTEQMLKYAVAKFTPKGFNLSTLKNMMISTDGRVEIDLLRKIANIFLPAKLKAAAMSAVYNHCFNPIISTRSYMTVAPVDLFLDPVALRQGYISIVNQAENPNALRVQDSGMVPICTEIAIVNPETCNICREGEFGEIWVLSEANLTSFTNGPKGPVDNFIKRQFAGKIAGDETDRTYLRTGDLGFLHHISITKNHSNGKDQEVTSFQPLFVLGKISDTFEVMGLHHFPLDIESTIEACHPEIYKNGSCIFKCSDYTIVVCEARRSKSLAALVPIIVNTVFSKHHLIVDIVAFIKRGEFPISRLGTKQRARIVDAWVQGIIPLSVLYGVNYGENSMIRLVKQIDQVTKNKPFMELKNPAQDYYDATPESVFENAGQTLNLNTGKEAHKHKATFDMGSLDSDDFRA